jgi:hypothetical protein
MNQSIKMNPYTSYYVNQVGTGIPAFQGIRYQRGHGFFGRIFSSVVPFLKNLLPELGKKVLPSAVGLATDIIEGQNVKQSALNRLKQAGTDVAEETIDQIKTRLQKRKANDQEGARRNKQRKKRVTFVPKKTNKTNKKKANKKRRRRRKLPNYLK